MSWGGCMNLTSVGQLLSCLLVAEASSSKTAFFSYGITPEKEVVLNPILGRSKYVLDGQRIDEYANMTDGKGSELYFEVLNNPVITEHINNTECPRFDLHVLSTGGMRNKVCPVKQEIFYGEISDLFEDSVIDSLKLQDARTISGDEEGKDMWSAFGIKHQAENHLSFDMGGETLQIASQDYVMSYPIGKEAFLRQLGESREMCDNSLLNYNGESCRSAIRKTIDKLELHKLDVNSDKVYLSSNFYYAIKNMCDIYMPIIKNQQDISGHTSLQRLEEVCAYNMGYQLKVYDYSKLTDFTCSFWEDSWSHEQKLYAKSVCEVGNYAHEFLTSIGMPEEQQLVADEVDWALGAAYKAFNLYAEL